jgi:hypothetical protein
VAHWAFDWQLALQLNVVSSQMPVLHCEGALHGWPVGTPQVPSAQVPARH